MRFRFCGDLDCPDWVLAEMAILSKLTSIKMRILVAMVVKQILEQSSDDDKVAQFASDVKFDVKDVHASIAVIHFIVSSATKHTVSSDVLNNELQQLGLPKEHAQALCKVYSDNSSRLEELLRNQSLRLTRMESSQWKVNLLLPASGQSPESGAVPTVEVQMKLRDVDNKSNSLKMTMSVEQCITLRHELQRALETMESVQSS